jgi:hypothetical protein
MLNYKQYYWLNSKYFLLFGVGSIIFFGIFVDPLTILIWSALVVFLNLVVVVGDYVAWKKYKKRNPND